MAKDRTFSYTGTGAALSLEMGFCPARVEIFTEIGNMIGVWTSSMSNASVMILHPYIDMLTTDPVPQIGTTTTRMANLAFKYRIASINYSKAAVAAGTALTATTVPQNKWGLFGFELGADGTLDANDASGNATGYSTLAAALAAKPAASASHVRAFHVAVMSTASGGFVGNTTALNDPAVTAYFYAHNDALQTSGGITPLSITGQSVQGVTIGTNAYINTAGAKYIIKAYRAVTAL